MATSKMRFYNSFAGVDFSNINIARTRSSDALNVWKNYDEQLAIETRKGLKLVKDLGIDNTIYGIHKFEYNDNDYILTHIGTTLVLSDYPSFTTNTNIITNMNPSESTSFNFNGAIYIKDGLKYIKYDGVTVTDLSNYSEGYIPTESINRTPLGVGESYQKVNVLNPKRKNTFVSDGTSVDYYLSTNDIDTDFTVLAEVNGIDLVENTDFTVNEDDGIITFNIPPATGSDGTANVIITFRKTIEEHRNLIQRCNRSIIFDNRVFFTGNPNYPNKIFWSELNNPTFVGDTNYATEGDESSSVKDMVVSNNALWVFKEPNNEDTTIFYHTPMTDYEVGKTYVSQHSSINTGCISKAINFNDDIVFFSNEGMQGISGTINSEQFVHLRSSLVNPSLLNESDYKNLIMTEWKGYLLCLIGNKIYLADSRQKYADSTSFQYEWYLWDMEQEITYIKAINGILIMGSDDGKIYSLTEDDTTFTSYWTIPSDDFDSTSYLKTSNKRGGVCELKKKSNDAINVYVKTNKDTSYDLITTINDTKGYGVYNIKKKKWVDISVKFQSNKPFGLINCSLQAFYGGYVKR